MIELIKIILQLPELNLLEDDLKELSSQLNSLETQTLETITFALRDENISEQLRLNKSKILFLFKSLFNLADKIIPWFKFLSNLYKDETKKSLTSDSMIPLMISLLPNDRSQLNSIYKKLKHVELLSKGEQACVLLSFYMPIHIKLELQTNDPAHSEMSRLVERLQKRILVNTILGSCIAFKTSLANKFIKFYKLQYEEQYASIIQSFTKEDNLNNDTIIDFIKFTINETISDDKKNDRALEILILQILNRAYPSNDDCLNLYRNQYLIMLDIKYILTQNSKTSLEILEAFTEKFHNGSDMLKLSNDSSLMHLIKTPRHHNGIKSLFNFFGIKTRKENFLELATQISHNFQSETEQLNLKSKY